MNNKNLSNITKILTEDYGFERSMEVGFAVDKNSNPLPLYTYPAIEYLSSIDFSSKKIFEFGSGYSTLWWIGLKAEVVSVESDEKWVKKLTPDLEKLQSENSAKHQYIFAPKDEDYINSILKFPDFYFDVIVIDGIPSRALCAKNAIEKVKKDGMVILDNADWYPNTAAFLKEKLDFIQVDFYGLRPSRDNAAVTSIFLSREFNFKNKSGRQPRYAVGGKIKHSAKDNFDNL